MVAPLRSGPNFIVGDSAIGGRYMLTHAEYYQSELIKLLNYEIERRKENLVTAHRAEGSCFATYKHDVGIIEGLRLALEISQQAEQNINSR